MKVGILTGGGDCPGLNGVLRAVVRRGEALGHKIVGIMDGWKGLLEARYVELSYKDTEKILSLGGTIIGTSRTNPLKKENGVGKIFENFKKENFDALIAIGGEDTLGVAHKLFIEGLPVVGIPKTIDNDLEATDFTFGFDTAVNIAMEAIDRIHTTTASHHRVMVVEVMGRHAGWIATYAGIIGSADVTLVPEEEFDIETVCFNIRKSHERKGYALVVVSEGAKFKEVEIVKDERKDAFGHVILGGIGERLSKEIEKRTGFETRSVVLGHLQRGGSPTAFDRMLATRFGVAAIDLVHKRDFGKMVALRGNEIVVVELKDAVEKIKRVDLNLYNIAKIFSN